MKIREMKSSLKEGKSEEKCDQLSRWQHKFFKSKWVQHVVLIEKLINRRTNEPNTTRTKSLQWCTRLFNNKYILIIHSSQNLLKKNNLDLHLSK